jgi:ABC-type uncharacterized transport system YnjBCD ATPase subunit
MTAFEDQYREWVLMKARDGVLPVERTTIDKN